MTSKIEPMKIEPSNDHATLVKQFKSLLRMYNGSEIHKASLTREVSALSTQLGYMQPAEIESQRDANAELTALLEKQEIKLAEQSKELTSLRTMRSNQAMEILALREELLIKPGTGNTQYRAAADIYYQLVQECGIPDGGSLVTYVETLHDAAGNMVAAMRGAIGMSRAQAVDELDYALDASNQGKADNEI